MDEPTALRARVAALEAELAAARGGSPTHDPGDLQRALFDSALDAIVVLDDHGTIIEANPAAANLTGVPVAELRGQHQRVFAPPAHDADGGWQAFLAAGAQVGESAITRPDGSVRHTEYRAVGHVLPGRHVAVWRDVTEQRAAEQALSATAARLKAVVDAAPVMVFATDRDGRFTLAEGRALRTLGLPPRSYIGESALERQRDWTGDDVVGRALRGETVSGEFTAGGRSVMCTVAPTRDASGEITGTIGVSIDVSERAHAQKALAASEARFRAVVEQSQDGVCLLDGQLRTLFRNRRLTDMFGYTDAQIAAMDWTAFFPPEDLPGLRAQAAELMSGHGRAIEVHLRVRHADGRWRWIEGTLTNLLGDPAVGAIVGALRDVTERRAQERERAAFFAQAADLICIAERDGRILRLNPMWERVLGWPLDELYTRPWHEFVHAEDVERTLDTSRAHVAGTPPPRLENRLRCKDGSYRWLSWSSTYDPESGLHYSVARDVTASRQAELRDRLLFAESPVPAWLLDAETLRFLDVNAALGQLTGHSRGELLAMTVLDLLPASELPDFHDKFPKAVSSGVVRVPQRKLKTRRGTAEVEITGQCLDFGGRLAVLAVVRDITNERALQAQLAQAQRLEAIGRLAGGIAHDFNNILSVILSYAALAVDGAPADSELRADLGEIEKAATRASRLTRQLLAFGRQQVVQPIVVDLDRAIRELAKMLAPLLGETIELALDAVPTARPVNIDPGQLEQVVMNLAINAADAMPRGGVLTIGTATVELHTRDVARYPGARSGRYVRLTVRDTGLGMDAATRARIFEPFFTTKPRERGTGLGLATVYGIVQQAEGHITVDTEPGRGTAFHIFLPAADVPPPARISTSRVPVIGGPETVLLVEDEAALRSIMATTLRRQGYVVLEAPDGQAARDLARSHAGAIEILVTDMVMPRMNGRELADALTQLRPGIQVLFVSGYPADELGTDGVLPAGVAYLQKPIKPSALAARIRELLDARRR